jgi:AraC-like DNA-binding protein
MVGSINPTLLLQQASFEPSLEMEKFLYHYGCHALSTQKCCGVWTAKSGVFDEGRFLICGATEAFVLRVEPDRGQSLFVVPMDSGAPLILNGYEIPRDGFGVSSSEIPLILHSRGATSFLLAWSSPVLPKALKDRGPVIFLSGPARPEFSLDSQESLISKKIGLFVGELATAVSLSLRARNPALYVKSPLRLRNRMSLVLALWNHFATTIDSASDLPDIAHRNGVCQRTLEYAFRDIVGTTPIGFVKTLRLHRARRMITGGEVATVKEGVTKCGMFHFGRFSLDYRAQFGRHPRQDLRDSRKPSVCSMAA